ncbi:Sb-PDE family phosphodiesterase [candidate division KSB1 bacterium]
MFLEKNRKHLSEVVFLTVAVVFLLVFSADSFSQTRKEINIPDIPGYITLKCDFHMHTVFSDGQVWPTVRVDEAWLEGLDAISITDHIEYQPKDEVVKDEHNLPYRLARSKARQLNLLNIQGTEVTRSVPPGHLNAIFITDAKAMDTEDYMDALRIAKEQGGFIFWNHPSYKQVNNQSIWHIEHTEILERGLMQGIEVVNGSTYYPEAHQWCLDKKLTMIGTSDSHTVMAFQYGGNEDDHRPMTLVFAEERTAESLKEALFDRRTVVYWQNSMAGEEKFLKPLFHESLDILNTEITIRGTGSVNVQIHNKSDMTYRLRSQGSTDEITFPGNIELPAGKTVLLNVRGSSEETSGRKKVKLPLIVSNMYSKPREGLQVEIELDVTFIPTNR